MLFTYPLTLEIQLNRTKLGYIVWQTFPLHLTNSLTLWRLLMKYISIIRGYISGTNNGQTNICFAGVYRHKYLVLGRDKSLKCRKKSLIPAESSQKLKSSKCLCFDWQYIRGKLLTVAFSPFCNLASPPYFSISRPSYWY